MTRELLAREMEELLRAQWYGHLACSQEDGMPYVVPVTYAYRDHALYCFSFEGKKIDVLRRHSQVCFQVEKLSKEEWKSVMVWGTFEELSGNDKKFALDLLIQRLWEEGIRERSIYLPFRSSEHAMEAAIKDKGVVLYRINIVKMTGRWERYE